MKVLPMIATFFVIIILFAVFAPLYITRALAYDTLSANDDAGGSYIINYVYEVEVKKPELLVDKSEVAQGGSITIRGANFANSTVNIQAFDEKLLVFNDDDKVNQAVGLLLASSDILLVQSAMDKAVMKKFTYDNDFGQASNGTITLVIKTPSSWETQNSSADLQCKGTEFSDDPMTVSLDSGIMNSSSRQFMNTSLPAGNYRDCQAIVTLSETGKVLRSEPLDFTVIPAVHAEGADRKATVVASDGMFKLRVSLHKNIQPGTYVFLAEEQLSYEDAERQAARALVPVQVLAKQQVSATHEKIQESSVESSLQSNSSSNLSSSSSIDISNSNDQQPIEDSNSSNDDSSDDGQEEQPPSTPPPDGGPKELCTTDDSSFESSNDATYTNTLLQTSIQTANNAIINNDAITITQRIVGVPSASQNVVTSVDVRSDNEVTQSIRQNIVQKAEVEHCRMVGDNEDNGIGGVTNATNFALSAALQEAYNIYSDSDVIKIQQTIIIPKYCEANVYAPITIEDRNRIAQSIDQDIVQKSKVKFLTSGKGGIAEAAGHYSYLQKNYVTQLSIQGAGNIAFDNNVININQAIIVPASCDAEVYAPVVIKSSSDIQLSITQKAEQVSTIELVGQQAGVTIANAISTGDSSQANGGSIFTNTIFNYADQYGENLFIDNDRLEVVQQIFYVNDTTGWTLDNYQGMLAAEFGGNGDNSSLTADNQASDAPLQLAGGGDNNDTALAEETEAGPSNETSSENITSTAITPNSTNLVQQSGLQDAFNYNQDNITISTSQDAEGYQIDTLASTHEENDVEQTNGQIQEQDAAVAVDNNEIPANDATGTLIVDNSIEQTGVQLATNYNEENSETAVDQGALGNQVNASVEVTDENNVAQNDEQDQSQEATITTGGNNTSTQR